MVTPLKGSKFRCRVAVEDSQDCDSIISLHFRLLFANYLTKTFDQELSACWKKKLRFTLSAYRLPTHWSYFTGKISVNLFGSGSCLQIYRFHIPGLNSRSVKSDTVSSVTTVDTFLRSCVAPDAIGLGDAPRQSNASRL